MASLGQLHGGWASICRPITGLPGWSLLSAMAQVGLEPGASVPPPDDTVAEIQSKCLKRTRQNLYCLLSSNPRSSIVSLLSQHSLPRLREGHVKVIWEAELVGWGKPVLPFSENTACYKSFFLDTTYNFSLLLRNNYFFFKVYHQRQMDWRFSEVIDLSMKNKQVILEIGRFLILLQLLFVFLHHVFCQGTLRYL